MADILLEVCVDDAQGLEAALAGGADRIELCAALALGGLTPSVGLIAKAAQAGRPVHAMIRPRAGEFGLDAADIATMCADIAAVRQAGLAGVVLGASLPDGRLDIQALAVLVQAARGLDLTLHRAVDLTLDAEEAVEQAVALGFHRILSSGGAPTADQGLPRLDAMVRAARGRLVIMPGSGVTRDSLPALAGLPFREIHASCSATLPVEARARALGFQSGRERRCRAEIVAGLKQALTGLDRPAP